MFEVLLKRFAVSLDVRGPFQHFWTSEEALWAPPDYLDDSQFQEVSLCLHIPLFPLSYLINQFPVFRQNLVGKLVIIHFLLIIGRKNYLEEERLIVLVFRVASKHLLNDLKEVLSLEFSSVVIPVVLLASCVEFFESSSYEVKESYKQEIIKLLQVPSLLLLNGPPKLHVVRENSLHRLLCIAQ